MQVETVTLTREPPPVRQASVSADGDPGDLMRTCANCGSAMEKRSAS